MIWVAIAFIIGVVVGSGCTMEHYKEKYGLGRV